MVRVIDTICLLLIIGLMVLFSKYLISYNWTLMPNSFSLDSWYTLLTANFYHYTPHHLTENIAGLVVIWYLFYYGEYAGWPTKIFALVGSCLTTTLGILLFTADSRYAGLSGALHGMIVCACLIRILVYKQYAWSLVILFIAGKIALDCFYPQFSFHNLSQSLYGNTMKLDHFVDDMYHDVRGFQVSWESHLFGSIGGVLCALQVVARAIVSSRSNVIYYQRPQ